MLLSPCSMTKFRITSRAAALSSVDGHFCPMTASSSPAGPASMNGYTMGE